MDLNLLVAVAILALLLVIALAALRRHRRSDRLAQRFGPEYRRTVDEMGRSKAEAELLAREQRVQKLDIVPLAPHEAQRFRMEWQSLQARFVDSPRASVAEADLLVRDVMMRRGYPMSDFEHRAADISVDHPEVVQHYRAAHEIAVRDRRDQADTESLRQALVHYRALFAELLEVAEAPVRRPAPERRSAEARPGPFLRPDRAMASDARAASERERSGER